MRGDLKTAWPYAWSDIWVRLAETKDAPTELFAELYQSLMPKPRPPASVDSQIVFEGRA